MADQIELEVPADLSGERVDKAIATLLDISRSRAEVVVGRGVSLDGRPARSSDRVSEGQKISCYPPDDIAVLVPEAVEFEVTYEDDHVLVVDKPPGVVVHPGTRPMTRTLAAGLIHRFPELVGVGQTDRWGLVHRLDKDTSGLILVGRTPEAYDSLVGQLRRREVARRYTALVEGSLGAPTGTIEAPIGRDQSRPSRRALTHGGKPARTHFEVLEHYGHADCSLVAVTLETGRTHQIRVHMASIGHPVIGDVTYGATRRDIGAPRTFLHATSLSFDHPFSGDRIQVDSDLPADLVAVIERLAHQSE